MNNNARETEYIFRPHRGLENTILTAPKTPGYMYYATDSHRMFFDLDDVNRQGVRGEGVIFVYGDAYTEDSKPSECEDIYFITEDPNQAEVYLYPRNKIQGHYNLNDVIINLNDGSFYKIINVVADPIYVKCELLMVAGSGGSRTGLRLREGQLFPTYLAYGKKATASFIPVSYEGHTSGYIDIYLYRSENANSYAWTTRYPVRMNEETTVEIPAEQLVAGNKNFVTLILRTSDGMESVPLAYHINCIDMKFQLDSTWDYSAVFSELKPVNVPWRVTLNTTDSVPNDLKVLIDWTFAGVALETESYDFKANTMFTKNFAPQCAALEHGAYYITAKATTNINNTVVDIGSFIIEFPWVKDSTKPIIWSLYPDNSVIEKYTTVSIVYYVYDPLSIEQGKASVIRLVANGEQYGDTREVNSTDVWDIVDYNEGTNSFSIHCRDAVKTFIIEVVPNPNIKGDPISTGCMMWLRAKGRANTENAVSRASWKNEVADTLAESDFTYGVKPQLTGFNWYNNGWVKDKDGYNVLRLSNGAKVTIPLSDLRSFQNRTYEFDFRVHNAINFSKLIGVRTKLDENGKPIEIEGVEQVEKYVSSGEGAFLTYYDTSKSQGYMLGTQEAFFGYSGTDIVNARYADDARVKISFVVRYADATDTAPAEKYIYLYVDGVLSAAYPIVGNATDLASTASAIVINSDYCDVDIYNIRIYNIALDYNQIVTNWVGDSSAINIMTQKYNRNNITTGSGLLTTIDYEMVKNSGLIPVMVLTTYGDGTGGLTDLLPFKKDDKRMCGVRYYDPFDVSKCFHAYNCEIDVQGTSSQGYPRRNFKLKTKKYNDELPFYFEVWDGVEENKNDWKQLEENITEEELAKWKLKKWDLGHGMPETTFCLKADYMESSSTHNTGLANLVADIQKKSKSTDAYDFRHPLARLENQTYARTTIYGYPILLFHEQKKVDSNGTETNVIEFVGKYNFNIDKGATDSFGFTYGEVNNASQAVYPEYREHTSEEILAVELITNEDGSNKTDADGNLLCKDYSNKNDHSVYTEVPLKHGDNPVKAFEKGTYEEVAECWEFTQNQAGPGKFQEQKNGFLTTVDGTAATKIIAADHFEARYHYADFDDPYEKNTILDGNALFTQYTRNFAKMWEWVASTDVSASAVAVGNLGKRQLDNPVFYRTRDTQYNEAHKDEYYVNPTDESPLTITFGNVVTMVDPGVSFDANVFKPALESFEGYGIGDYSLVYDADGSVWRLYYGGEQLGEGISNLAETFGIVLPSDWGTKTILFSYTNQPTNWTPNLYQKFTIDTVDYRLAKFRNEFTQHFNLSHTLFYFIITELLLLYDSRQKNMMIASWGPEVTGGNYIWYPIFYDMDTQLGINNSGQVYWDYDTDATPKDNPNASIFSGTGSVLWANLATCFEEEIKQAYRLLRASSEKLSAYTLETAYNTNQSDKWSEQMKNIDAFYKYIAPTSLAYGGFINTDGENKTSSLYLYCLQGDRKLNRSAFFRNRLNYIDSQWLGGSYNPINMSEAITMRYNLNEHNNTSDDAPSSAGGTFSSTPNFEVTPFLSQYVSIAYDKIATNPVKFDLGDTQDSILVEAPNSILSRADAGVALTQQLAYVYGPQYISDLGDLSDKYLNLFQGGTATRLRNLQIGNDKPGYFNTQFKDLEKTENSAGQDSAKGLLENIDFSNLSGLEGTYDVSGCSKLKRFKALGTKFSQIILPSGNLLEKLYLPSTITSLSLIAPLSLTSVIEDKVNASWIEETNEDGTTTWKQNNQPGLYVENLTDKLNTETIPPTAYTKIDFFQMDDTNMGYDTYRMLNYLYRIKLQAQGDNLTESTQTTSKGLRIQAKNVQWSPYVQVVEGEVKKEGTSNYYYVRNDDMTYSAYTGDDTTWNYDIKNLGVYKREYADSPITNLAMLDKFITDYDEDSCQIENGTTTYYFRAINDDAGDTTKKLLPVITGNLHVNNTATTPIKEIDLYKKYCSENHFGDLTITANYIDPCYRAKFVEFNNGGTIVHGWQRSDKPATIAYAGDAPERLYYDFLGWAIYTKKLEDSQSIGTLEDVFMYPDGTFVSGATSEMTTLPESSEEQTLVLVAVFQLHRYKITFLDGDDNPMPMIDTDGEEHPYGLFSARDVIVPPIEIPSKDESLLDFEDCYNFLGYGASVDTDILVTFGNIYPTRDTTYYAKFEVKNIYDNPLPVEQLHYVKAAAGDGMEVALNAQYKRRGKVCVPKSITVDDKSYDVVGILGRALATSSGSYDSGFAQSDRLTHVFMQGTKDNTCKITRYAAGAFSCEGMEMRSSLMHVDIPSSLVTIGQSAFHSCNKLKITNFKNVRSFGKWCMYEAGGKSDITTDDIIYISGNVTDIGGEAFRYTKAWYINIGSAATPVTTTSIFAGTTIFAQDFNTDSGSGVSPMTVTIFTTVDNTTMEDYFNTQNGADKSVVLNVVTV